MNRNSWFLDQEVLICSCDTFSVAFLLTNYHPKVFQIQSVLCCCEAQCSCFSSTKCARRVPAYRFYTGVKHGRFTKHETLMVYKKASVFVGEGSVLQMDVKSTKSENSNKKKDRSHLYSLYEILQEQVSMSQDLKNQNDSVFITQQNLKCISTNDKAGLRN